MTRRPPPDLRRKPATKDPKSRFTLFVEGANTEVHYFEALKRTIDGTLVEVRTFGPSGVPEAIARKAIVEKKSRSKKNSYENNDSVWAVFDRDEHRRYD